MPNTLEEMVEAFRKRHKRDPEKIIIAGIALVGLALRKSLKSKIKIECRLFSSEEITLENKKVKNLGIFVQQKGKKLNYRCCDLI